MSNFTKSDLEERIKGWLKDDKLLGEVRAFLGDRALNDAKIANWGRSEANRGIPNTLIEGAALDWFGAKRDMESAPVYGSNVLGEEFWQVFSVSTPSSGDKPLDCSTYRLWTNVRQIEDTQDTQYFSHRTWFSGCLDQDDRVMDLSSVLPHPDQLIAPFSKNQNDLSLLWAVDPGEKKNIGYRVNLKETVRARSSNERRYEYLGGVSGLQTSRMSVLLALPVNLLQKSKGLLDESEPLLPQSMRYFSSGTPLEVIEGFLREQTPRKWLSPWFKVLGPLERVSPSDIDLPAELASALDSDGVLQRDQVRFFFFRVDSPIPFLNYMAVFELRD